jgi:hypothetical protein
MGQNYYCTVENSYSTGDITGDMYVGGVVGFNFFGIVENSYSTGGITGDWYVGGVVGENYGTVKNSLALNSSIERRTSGFNTNFGRVVGENTGTLGNNYAWIGMDLPSGVTATDNADGIHGGNMSATQLKTKDEWEDRGFDFDTIWNWNGDDGMPSLRNGGTSPGTAQPWPEHLPINQHFTLEMEKFTIINEGEGIFEYQNFGTIILDRSVQGHKVDIDISALTVSAVYIGNIRLNPVNGIITLYASQFNNAGTYTLSIHFTHNNRPWLGSLDFTVIDE